ncbi:TetR/AcrR family transcriptional regulator [Rhodococcus olei]|uniref:TetR/AcrR family transcriptional regulator n=1 Tax=Rhodococcus olei TaxID=2161675 RepID=A0ABP8NXA3_9NOCA
MTDTAERDHDDVAGDDPLDRDGPPTGTGLDRLLRAALELFSDKGFEATRTRDISARAGLSPAALYVHFASKEEVLHHLVRTTNESTLRALRDAVEPYDDPISRLRAFVTEFSLMHARGYQHARVAQYESRHLLPEHAEIIARTRLQIREAARAEVQRGIDAGVFTIAEPRVAVLAIMSLSIDICRWYRPDGAVPAADLADINSGLILQILRAPGHR